MLHEKQKRELTIMDKDYMIAVAGTGDGDIIGTTKKNHVESGLLAA